MILLYPFTIIFSCDHCCPVSWFGRNAHLIASVVVLWKSVNPFGKKAVLLTVQRFNSGFLCNFAA